MKMKIGDVVSWGPDSAVRPGTGIIIGFNEKGDGGQHYAHILNERGVVVVVMSHTLEVIEPEDTNRHGKKQKYLKED